MRSSVGEEAFDRTRYVDARQSDSVRYRQKAFFLKRSRGSIFQAQAGDDGPPKSTFRRVGADSQRSVGWLTTRSCPLVDACCVSSAKSPIPVFSPQQTACCEELEVRLCNWRMRRVTHAAEGADNDAATEPRRACARPGGACLLHLAWENRPMNRTLALLQLPAGLHRCTSNHAENRNVVNPNESGRGYVLEVSGSTLAVTIYTYDQSWERALYLATGTLANNGADFQATLYKYSGGQCLACDYTPAVPNDEDVRLPSSFRPTPRRLPRCRTAGTWISDRSSPIERWCAGRFADFLWRHRYAELRQPKPSRRLATSN